MAAADPPPPIGAFPAPRPACPSAVDPAGCPDSGSSQSAAPGLPPLGDAPLDNCPISNVGLSTITRPCHWTTVRFRTWRCPGTVESALEPNCLLEPSDRGQFPSTSGSTGQNWTPVHQLPIPVHGYDTTPACPSPLPHKGGRRRPPERLFLPRSPGPSCRDCAPRRARLTPDADLQKCKCGRNRTLPSIASRTGS